MILTVNQLSTAMWCTVATYMDLISNFVARGTGRNGKEQVSRKLNIFCDYPFTVL